MCQKVQNGGGGWEGQGVISELLAAPSVLYQGGEGWQCAMARSQGYLPLKQTGLPSFSWLVPFLSPSGKVLAHGGMPLCSRLTNGLAGSSFVCWLCCCPGTAALELLPCALLAWFSTPCRNPTDVHAVFPCMLLQGAVEQKPGRLLPEILLSSCRLTTVSRKCVFCVKKNW